MANPEKSKAATERPMRKTRIGLVVSDKMQKTVVVAIERRVAHPQYGKMVTHTKRLKAHDELNDAHTGDTVLIEESRPLSATKRWRLIEVVARAGTHGSTSEIVVDEEATSEAIHSAAHPGRHSADDTETENAAASSANDAGGSDDDADATESAVEGGPA